MSTKSLVRSVTRFHRRLHGLRTLLAGHAAPPSAPRDRALRVVVGVTPICGLAGVRLLSILAGPAGIHIT